MSEPTTSTLVAIRAAHHPEATPKYDRVVFEFRGPVPLLLVEYVKQLSEDGSGKTVSLPGTAILHIQMSHAQAHDASGQVTAPINTPLNLSNVKAVMRAGDFEGVVSYGIGLNKKAETRIITMDSPSRIVIDVLS